MSGIILILTVLNFTIYALYTVQYYIYAEEWLKLGHASIGKSLVQSHLLYVTCFLAVAGRKSDIYDSMLSQTGTLSTFSQYFYN